MAKLKDGFYKLTASSIGSDLLVLLAGGGSKPISDFALASSLSGYVTLGTALTITGLKTFLSNSSTTGISLILKNSGWLGNMSTAMDFYNGSSYKVPNARIETKMVGDGKAGGTLIFYTLTKHASTNPNPNDLTERLRIDDSGITTLSGLLKVTSLTSIYNGSNLVLLASSSSSKDPGDLIFANSSGDELCRLYYAAASNHLNIRFGSSASSYAVLHGGNYNSYAPTLTGGGASGTWNINVSGWSKQLLTSIGVVIDANTVHESSTGLFYDSLVSSDSTNIPTCLGFSNSLLTLCLHDTANRAAQLYTYHNGPLFFRSARTAAWQTVLTSTNYSSVLNDSYYTKAEVDSKLSGYWKVNGQTTVGTGDIYLEMWRGANASWKMINNGGVLKFLCNYTSAAGSYYDALTVAYNTGNVWAKGSITSATGIHNSSTTLYLDSASTTTSIIFRHGTTERMRIALPDGYVGIGTSSPTARLHVAGLVNITANSGTLTIGSLNTLYTHYSTTGGTHWFNKAVAINGNHYPHVTNSFSSGTSGYRWSNVYSLLGNFAGTVSINCACPNIVCNNNASGATESNIRFEIGGINKGYVGFVDPYGTYLYNSSAAKCVYINNNGYFYTQSYINVGAGNEKNASNPPYVWGVNGSDNFMRTYATSSLSVGRAANADYAISSPAMANYGGTGSTTKIKIKINSTTSWMLSFVVTIYLGYESSKIMVSGYNYGSSYWYEPEAVLLGDSNGATSIPVYFGYDSTWNLWVGFDGGKYTGVSISDVTNGYTQISSLKGLFTISNVSSLTTLQKTVTAVNSVNYAATANVANYTTCLYANSTTNLITKPGYFSLAYSRFLAEASNIFPTGNNANGVITAHLHSGEYYAQIGLSSNGRMYYRTMMDQTLDAGVEWNKVAFSTDTMSYITVTNSDANSTYRMVWHSGDSLYSTAGIYCNPSTDYLYAAHFYENSDILLKTNILEILRSDNIPTIKEFDWKEDGSHSYGLIAQELEELGYSELVSVKDDGYKTVNYSAALSLIVGKLQVKIKELEKEIEILKNKN